MTEHDFGVLQGKENELWRRVQTLRGPYDEAVREWGVVNDAYQREKISREVLAEMSQADPTRSRSTGEAAVAP